MTAQLSSASQVWMTPDSILWAADACLGGIDLDPASCLEANARVGAAAWFGKGGLDKPWHGSVFLNPPGGIQSRADYTSKSQAVQWWCKLADEYTLGRVKRGIFVVFAAGSFFQAVQREYVGGSAPWRCPWNHQVCMVSQRLRFLLTVEERLKMKISKEERADLLILPTSWMIEGPAPTHANAIIGVGVNPSLFKKTFSEFGDVIQ